MTEPVTDSKGSRRRQEIIDAAAWLLRETGPTGVTHRTVASRAGCSLSATTYYFSGLDELLGEAGSVNIRSWADRARRVEHEVLSGPRPEGVSGVVDVILRACLPGSRSLENHYLQLVAATNVPAVNQAYREGRALLDDAVQSILSYVGCSLPPSLVIATIDGAAVAALSEGRDIRGTARSLLTELLESSNACESDIGEVV